MEMSTERMVGKLGTGSDKNHKAEALGRTFQKHNKKAPQQISSAGSRSRKIGYDAVGTGVVLKAASTSSLSEAGREDAQKKHLAQKPNGDGMPRDSSVDSFVNSTDGLEDGNASQDNVGRHLVVIQPERSESKCEDGSRLIRGNAFYQDTSAPPRLLLISSRVKNSSALTNAALPNIIVVNYKYDSSSLENINGMIADCLAGKKVDSIAIIMTGSGLQINVCRIGEKVLTATTITENESVREFFTKLVVNYVNTIGSNARLDFLLCGVAPAPESELVMRELESLTGVTVCISKDIFGADVSDGVPTEDISRKLCVGDLYFRSEKLRGLSGRPSSNTQTTAGYERIRTVGKGAYGTAVLYRRREDESLVILKEINMHDLSASERQMALNEVKVLALLDHPNIISYYDSFEEDGILMIEMEYADGGTLAQLLSKHSEPLKEMEVLHLFQQMVSGIRHMHEHSILHRDLKTQNIFLTKEGIVKIGDFGISKMMSTTSHAAQTVLGTPYYISPEMCEGKPYNEKSDIWALGCILYEMACRQKTFEGTNLPALVNKIMKGQFAPVKGSYSIEFKDLVRDMLQREPEYRPSANELLYARLPELLSRVEDAATDVDDDTKNTNNSSNNKKKRSRSVVYNFDINSMRRHTLQLPVKAKVRQVAASSSHIIIVTMDRAVYTYGANDKGQLGHGDLQPRNVPTLVIPLKGKSIARACAGEGFSIFSSDNGIIMTCGDGSSGCLGHGDWSNASRPRLIEALLSVDVTSIASGPRHVVVASSDGAVYAWGCGADGRLGLGTELDRNIPSLVTIEEPVIIRQVHCGTDGTMFITDAGTVLACGSNKYNKLGLNQRYGFFQQMRQLINKAEVEGTKTPTPVKAFKSRVLCVSMGPNHTAALLEPGQVVTFGRNTHAQLGHGNMKAHMYPMVVKSLIGESVTIVSCGAQFTVACSLENILYFWGSRKVLYVDDSTKTGESNVAANKEVEDLANGSNGCEQTHGESHSINREMELQSVQSGDTMSSTLHNETSSLSQDATDLILSELPNSAGSVRSIPGRDKSARSRILSTESRFTAKNTPDEIESVLKPTQILRLDIPPPSNWDVITLSEVIVQQDNILVVIDTTAAPPRRKNRKKKIGKRRAEHLIIDAVPNSASSRDGGDEFTSSENSEPEMNSDYEITAKLSDTRSSIPAWLKKELASPNPEDDFDLSALMSTQIHTKKKIPIKSSKPPSASTESGIDLNNPDILSSSSSSDTLAAAKRLSAESNLSTKKTANNAHYKGKTGAPAVRPVNRVRPSSRSKPQRSLQSESLSSMQKGGRGFISEVTQRKREEALQVELQHMQEEKILMEERIKQLEEERSREEKLLSEQREQMAQEREEALLKEMEKMRLELQAQNQRMIENQNQVLELQAKVSSNTDAKTASNRDSSSAQKLRPVSGSSQASASSQKQSKVCLVQ